jgi:toxin ParE1/3/4
MSFRLKPEAEADIERIALYIAADNPTAAQRWIGETYRRCKLLGEMPEMGVARPEIRPDLRMFTMGNYLILYRAIENGAEIIRVVHGARLWQELL